MAKTRKMLSDWRAPYIQSLTRLIETQSRRLSRLGRLITPYPYGKNIIATIHVLKRRLMLPERGSRARSS